MNISFVTFTNFGYLHFTQNLILSLEKINFPLSLKVYCIDQKSYDSLRNWNQNIILEILNDETNKNEKIVGWKEKGWNTMAFSKLKCIYKELLQNEYVFFTDSDIVFEKDPLEYLLKNIKDYDMLIQQNSGIYLCSGFMFIKSNDIMKDLFNWLNINLNSFICDEDYINDNKDNFKYLPLKRELFPTEKNYFNNNNQFYIIHFNKRRGDNKCISYKIYNKWYLNFNPCEHIVNNEIYNFIISKPDDKNLISLINYFKINYIKSDNFNIYLTGRYNSNQKGETNDIDLLVSYKDKKNKNYGDIYDCLFFIKDKGLTRFNSLIDIKYEDNIILKQFSMINIDEINNFLINRGESIIYDLINIKRINKNSTNYTKDINDYKIINLSENKKLYISKNDKPEIYLKKVEKYNSYRKDGCIYYNNKLL